jgi:DNA-binding CsgD family transcriptional regulator
MPINQIRQFIQWMSFHPGMEDIARALANDYLVEFEVKGVRFGLHNSDDSIILLGQYGYSDAMAWRNRTIPSEEWRAIKSEDVQLIVSASGQKWTNDSKSYVSTLRDHGVIQGYLIVEFTNPIAGAKKEKAAESIEDLSMPIALYLSFQNRRNPNQARTINSLESSRESGDAKLSARQLAILRGMVEGKTNHELAIELGFSVSTIRHETMRIYHALAVSDRKEAAKKALMLSII